MTEPEPSPPEGLEEDEAPSLFRRLQQAGLAVGTAAILFAAALWVGEYAGLHTGIPYVLLGVGGLVVYNLARLPAYVRYFFPPREEAGEKFHRRDG